MYIKKGICTAIPEFLTAWYFMDRVSSCICICSPTRYTMFFYGRVYSQYLLALKCFRPRRSIIRGVFQSCMRGLVCGNTRTVQCLRPLRCSYNTVKAGSIEQCVYYHIPICSSSFERRSWGWTYEVRNTVELINIVNKLDHKRTLCI
jgi:hypothetical protein